MEYRPETVRDTAAHIATSAARSLSCEIAATEVRRHDEWLQVRVDQDGEPGITWEQLPPSPSGEGPRQPLLEQEAASDGALGSDEIIARFSLPLGREGELGTLTLVHTSRQPRGFTLLCQRIGRALAEASSLLIEQALVREALSAERAQLMQLAETDALTGLGNRRAWEEALAREAARMGRIPRRAAVLSADLDRLKLVNDRYGHAAGDMLIRRTAALLAQAARHSDLVCRVGGDEFGVLLADTDAIGARRFASRLRRLISVSAASEPELALQLSVGWAVAPDDGDLPTAVRIADRRMYTNQARRRSLPAR